MSAGVDGSVRATPFAAAHADIDALLTRGMTSSLEDEVLAQWRSIEALRNKLAAAEHACIAQAEQLGLPQTHAAVNTSAYMRQLLRISAREASARVRAAHAAGPGRR